MAGGLAGLSLQNMSSIEMSIMSSRKRGGELRICDIANLPITLLSIPDGRSCSFSLQGKIYVLITFEIHFAMSKPLISLNQD